MTNVPKCSSWRGHKFAARFSETPPNATVDEIVSNLAGNSIYAVKAILERMTGRVYEGDVCTRCGTVVNQRKPA